MASEDIFEEYTEEIVTELDEENINQAEIENEVEEETEDMLTAFINNAEEQTEEQVNSENNNTEGTINQSENNENTDQKENTENGKSIKQNGQIEREAKLFQLPLTRVRNIMKLDPDLNIASNEALFAVTRATELFIESLARESYIHTVQAKKKTVQKRDVDMAIAAVDSLMFLEGAMNF